MYTVENKTIKVGKPEKEVTYRELMQASTNAIKEQGIQVAEMRSRNRILDVLEKNELTYKFEDADFEKMKSLISQMHWGVIDREIVNFTDYIESLKRDE